MVFSKPETNNKFGFLIRLRQVCLLCRSPIKNLREATGGYKIFYFYSLSSTPDKLKIGFTVNGLNPGVSVVRIV